MMIVWIAILSLFDIIATGAGVSLGVIREGNPFVARLFERSVPGTCLLVAVVVGGSLWLIATQINRLRWIRPAMSLILVVKIVVTGMHLFWISLML